MGEYILRLLYEPLPAISPSSSFIQLVVSLNQQEKLANRRVYCMLCSYQQPEPKPLKDIHIDDLILVIIPAIISHPHCTLWLLLCSCFESKPRYL